jgi:hypothetical protein
MALDLSGVNGPSSTSGNAENAENVRERRERPGTLSSVQPVKEEGRGVIVPREFSPGKNAECFRGEWNLHGV